MKEFEDLELILNRNEKWLKQQHPFYLSEHFPIINLVLPKELEYLEEKDLPLLGAIIRRHWGNFIVNLMKELKEKPIKHERTKIRSVC